MTETLDDFGNPLEECLRCGDVAQCADGLCFWCVAAVSQQNGIENNMIEQQTTGLNIVRRGTKQSGAVFSVDEQYRFSLWRHWDAFSEPKIGGDSWCVFIGLNPSTADETENDPTVRRCINYAQQWGFHGMVMLNAFAYRATNPKHMIQHADPVGWDNDRVIRQWCSVADRIVLAWGVHGAHRGRDKEIRELLKDKPLDCLGQTQLGHPRHPLYLKSNAQPYLIHDPSEQ